MVDRDILERLQAAIAARRAADPSTSYVAALNAKGLDAILKKVGEEATETVIACRRYRCTACGAVVTVVPCGIEPRRHYGRAAICMALALWSLAGWSALAVRRRVGTYRNPLATTWRTLRRWATAAGSGAWSWCPAATGLAPRAAAARAAQIAAGRAPPAPPGPIWEQAYAGGAALA